MNNPARGVAWNSHTPRLWCLLAYNVFIKITGCVLADDNE
jgi:hypothetical protein